jgi:hypothetical protein
MAHLGQLSAPYDEQATPAKLKLARALREIHAACHPINMVALGKYLGYSPPAISHYFHARRVPSMATIARLHALACQPGCGKPPYSIEELRELHAAAWRRATGRSRGEPVRPIRRGDRRNASAEDMLTARGYRRNSNQVVPHAARSSRPGECDSAVNNLLGLPPSDRIGALWHLGGQLSTDELAEACATLVRFGLHEDIAVLLDRARVKKPTRPGEK